MTDIEALAEAERRWGTDAGVFDRARNDAIREQFADSIKRVGRYWVGISTVFHGNGNTWEEAFADADKRQEKSE